MTGDEFVRKSEVQLMIVEAIEAYDQKTSAPRHVENTNNFREIFEIINKLKGAWIAGSILVGIPVLIAAITDMLRYIHGR